MRQLPRCTFLLLLAAAPAAAQNLLANPDFADGLDGWASAPLGASWDAGSGFPAPGSLRLASSDCCTVALAQCLPAAPGEHFDFGARLRLGPVDPGTEGVVGDGMGADLLFHDTADCSGFVLGGTSVAPPVGRNWTLAVGTTLPAPAGTQAMAFRFRLYNFSAVEGLSAFGDGAWVLPAGMGAPLFGSGFEG